jgi:hypothetical protein
MGRKRRLSHVVSPVYALAMYRPKGIANTTTLPRNTKTESHSLTIVIAFRRT